jgi:hypothetical protein
MHLEMIGICSPSWLAPQPATPHPSSQDSKSREKSHRVQEKKRPYFAGVGGGGCKQEVQSEEWKGALYGGEGH